MMREKECPKCGANMQFEEDDHEVGIVGGWSCDTCGYIDNEIPDDDLDYGDE